MFVVSFAEVCLFVKALPVPCPCRRGISQRTYSTIVCIIFRAVDLINITGTTHPKFCYNYGHQRLLPL